MKENGKVFLRRLGPLRCTLPCMARTTHRPPTIERYSLNSRHHSLNSRGLEFGQYELGVWLGAVTHQASVGLAASPAGLGEASAPGGLGALPSSVRASPAVGGFSPGCSRAPVSSAGLAMPHSCGTWRRVWGPELR